MLQFLPQRIFSKSVNIHVSKNALLNVVQNYIMLTHNIIFNQNLIIKSSAITCTHIYGHPRQSYKALKFDLICTKRSLLLISSWH